MHQLNVSKCKAMHFGRSNPKFDYYTKDSENLTKYLAKKKREKDLGVTPDLSWKDYILEIAARANRMIGSFKKRLLSVEIFIFGKIFKFH